MTPSNAEALEVQLRKIVQIAATPESGRNFECVYALCNDGSVWHHAFVPNGDQQRWYRMPDIPQHALTPPQRQEPRA